MAPEITQPLAVQRAGACDFEPLLSVSEVPEDLGVSPVLAVLGEDPVDLLAGCVKRVARASPLIL
jgi:hypothetical protein